MQLHFIRRGMAYETSQYYECKTDVWVLGDVDGYRGFVATLRRAANAKAILRVACSRGNSMRVVVVPAARRPRAARLRLIERVVFVTSKPEMELVFFGNTAAYAKLGRLFERMMRQASDNIHDNAQLDDLRDQWVVRRSVGLNIRTPLARWSRRALEGHADAVYHRPTRSMPVGIEYLTKESSPYEEADPGYWPLSLDRP